MGWEGDDLQVSIVEIIWYYTCEYTCKYACKCTCVNTWKYTWKYTCMNTCMKTCMNTCNHDCKYTCKYTWNYTWNSMYTPYTAITYTGIMICMIENCWWFWWWWCSGVAMWTEAGVVHCQWLDHYQASALRFDFTVIHQHFFHPKKQTIAGPYHASALRFDSSFRNFERV